MDNALKGLAAGVDVTSASGQPGDSPRVRIQVSVLSTIVIRSIL